MAKTDEKVRPGASTRAVPKRGGDRTELLLLLLCVAASVGLSLYYFTGYYASDDYSYWYGGRSLLMDQPQLSAGFGSNRSGMLLIAALLLWLDGTGYAQSAALPLVLLHGVMVVICYSIGRILHGRTTALVTAALTAAFPMVYVYTGALLPDMPMGVLIGGATVLVAVIVREATEDRLSSWTLVLCSLGAGFLVGLAYLMKEYAVLYSAAALFAIVTSRGRFPFLNGAWLGVASFFIGLLLVMLTEVVIYKLVADIWLNRLNLGFAEDPVFLREMLDRRAIQGLWPWERIVFLFGQLSRTVGLWVIPIALALLVYPLLKAPSWPGRSPMTFLFIAYCWTILFLLFFPASVSPYLPPAIVDRYYIIALPAALPALGYVLARLLSLIRRIASRWVAYSALVILVGAFSVDRIVSTQYLAGVIYRAYDTQVFQTMYTVADNMPEKLPIAADEQYSFRMSRALPPSLVNGANLYTTWDLVDAIYQLRPDRYYALFEQQRRFYFLTHAGERLQQDAFPDLIGRCERKEVRLSRVGQNVFNPQRRFTRLLIALGVPAPAETHKVDIRGGYLLLVEPRSATDREGAVQCAGLSPLDEATDLDALFSLSSTLTVDGSNISWIHPATPTGYVQNLDDRSYKLAPTSGESELGAPVEEISAGMKLRGLSGEARVSLHIFGYEGNELVESYQTPTVEVTADQVVYVAGLLSADRTFSRVKLRLRVDVAPGSTGAMELVSVEIAPSVQQ